MTGRDYPVRRIFVDVSTIRQHDARTGIQRVVRALALHLARQAGPDLEVVAVEASKRFAYRESTFDFEAPPLQGWGRPLGLGAGDVFLGLDLCIGPLRRYEDQIARWRMNGALVAVVLYDLLPYSNPEWFNRRTSRHFAGWLGVLGRRADIILPISRHVSRELDKYLGRKHAGRADRIRRRVFPLSGDISQTAPSQGVSDSAEAALAALEGQSFLLMVGTIEPRKAHREILSAHRRCVNERPDCPFLVIVGKAGWRSEDVLCTLRGLTLERDRALWLPDASDETLDRLYRASSGLIAGSFNEGYCLPIAEARSYGKPVLARDIPVFREFEGPGISYFDGDDEADLCRAMAQLARKPPEIVLPERCGWNVSAQRVVEVLREQVEC